MSKYGYDQKYTIGKYGMKQLNIYYSVVVKSAKYNWWEKVWQILYTYIER